jgi:hypothetical protein
MHTERGMIRPFPIVITRKLAPGGEGAQRATARTPRREKWRNERRATTSGAVAAIFSGGRWGMRMAAAVIGGLVSLAILPAETAPRRTIGVPAIDVERTAPRPPAMPERRPPLPRPRPTALAQAATAVADGAPV